MPEEKSRISRRAQKRNALSSEKYRINTFARISLRRERRHHCIFRPTIRRRWKWANAALCRAQVSTNYLIRISAVLCRTEKKKKNIRTGGQSR